MAPTGASVPHFGILLIGSCLIRNSSYGTNGCVRMAPPSPCRHIFHEACAPHGSPPMAYGGPNQCVRMAPPLPNLPRRTFHWESFRVYAFPASCGTTLTRGVPHGNPHLAHWLCWHGVPAHFGTPFTWSVPLREFHQWAVRRCSHGAAAPMSAHPLRGSSPQGAPLLALSGCIRPGSSQH